MARSRTPLRIPFVAEVSAAIKSIRGLDKEIDGLDASARKAQESFRQAGDATDQAFDGAQDSVKAAEGAMRSLGIKSEQVADNQIAHLRQAFAQLKTSGAASTKEIERAYQNMQNRIQRINAQIGREGARTFQKLAKDASAQLRKVGDGMTSIGSSLSMKATAPITLGLGAIVREAGNFEQAMGAVQAVMGNLSTKEVDALSAAAEKLGADTKFSATEAANAIGELGGIGLDTTQILNGALDASVQTAAATGGQLDETAKLVASIMGQFKLGASDLKEIGDDLTGFTQASKFNIQEINYAFASGGAAAASAGLSVAEFGAAIAAIDYNFANGSSAGTSLEAFFRGLTPKSKEAIELMGQLGVRVKNTDGSYRSLVQIVDDLNRGLANFGAVDRDAALETLFGSEGADAAKALLDVGSAGIMAKLGIVQAGDAAKAADQRMAGFNGQVEQLFGALSSLAIAIGKSGILKMLTDLVKGVTEWVNWLAEASPATLKWGTILLALVAAIGPLLLMFGQLAIGAAIATTGISMLAAAIGGITLVGAGMAAGIGLAIGAAVAAVWIYRGEIMNALGDALRWIQENAARIGQSILETVFPIQMAIWRNRDAIIAAVSSMLAYLANIGGALYDFFIRPWVDAYNGIIRILDNIKQGGYSLVQFFRDLVGVFYDFLVAPWVRAYQAAKKYFSALISMARRAARYLGASGHGSDQGGRGYATGGIVRGPGTGTSDSIRAWLSNGEGVINARAVRHYGERTINMLNNLSWSPAQVMVPAMAGDGGGRSSGLTPVVVNIGGEGVHLFGDEPNVLKLLNSQARKKAARRTGRPTEW